MGNDLNIIKVQIHEEITRKINDTGNNKLSFNDEEMKVTKLPANELRNLLLDPVNDLTLPKVFQMFHYAKQKEMNRHCSMTDVFYFEPLVEAYEYQRLIDKRDMTRIDDLPLLGFVFSIKENLAIKGTCSTWGYYGNLGRIAMKTAPIIDFLRQKGGLLACKGNVPQALMAIESSNNIFGYCENPHDSERISGGSSGGEAVSIALGLVNVGIGSDLGGSLRIPALFSGICVLKPTVGRFDSSASVDLYEGSPFQGRDSDTQFIIGFTIGPMAKSVRDLISISKVLNEFNFTQLNLPRIPWIDRVEKPKKVGFIPEFKSYFGLPACCTRAFNLAQFALKSAGYELVEVNIDHLVEDIALNTFAAIFSDKGLIELITGQGEFTEPPLEFYKELINLFETPIPILRNLADSSIISSTEELFIKACLRAHDVNSMTIKNSQIQLIKKVLKEFENAGVEVALAYGLFPAPRHNQTSDLIHSIFYTCIWNFLNLPAGALPITTVQECEQFFQGQIEDKQDIVMRETMIGSKGLPVGVQVVGLPWKEELVLCVMQSIEENIEI